jgi:hypothetical protein
VTWWAVARTGRHAPFPKSLDLRDGLRATGTVKIQSTQLRSEALGTFGVAIRPTLLFVAAFALNLTPHEAAHAVADEGSLHLLQELGYPFYDGKGDSVTRPEIIIRFYPNSNPKHLFFFTQAALDEAATKIGLSRKFSEFRVSNLVR